MVPRDERATGGSVLVVDDNTDNLRLLAEILGEEGFIVRPAKSGGAALKAVRERPPDLVLLDVMMPEMDGYEVCRILQEDEKTGDIPVIFLTAKGAVEDIVKGFEAGAVDYVSKPFYIPELLARVRTHIKLQRTIDRLRDALDRIRTLEGFLPICAWCKKIRDEDGSWNSLEKYIRHRTKADLTHSICPDCMEKLYPDLLKDE